MQERGSQLEMGRSRYSAQRKQGVHAENRRRIAQRRKGKGKGPALHENRENLRRDCASGRYWREIRQLSH